MGLSHELRFSLYPSAAGCTKGGLRFFQLPQKGIKSNDTRDIELARDKK